MRDGRRRRSAHFRFQSGPVTSLACAPAWKGQPPLATGSLLLWTEAVAQTLGVIDFLCIHDKATISEGAFSVAESPVRPPEALL
jgi:hypothetical protein